MIEPTPQAPLTGMRVMVVEDEFMILTLIESALTDAGAKVVATCRNLPAALAVAEHEDLSAAVLDVQLGADSSHAVAERLDARRVPFLFYTGHVDDARLRAEWPGRPVITKPARPRTIVAALARLKAA